MKKSTPNPEIINTPNGVLVAYEFKIPPLNMEGAFNVGKFDMNYRTMVYEFDTDVYAFNNSAPDKNLGVFNLLHFNISEQPIDHQSKHITIEFGSTTFETVGNYVINTFNKKKAELDLLGMKSNDPTVSLF